MARKKSAKKDESPDATTRRHGVEVAVYGNDGGPLERQQHGPVQQINTLVDGRLARVNRSIDLMTVMLRNKTINPAQARAGRRFRDDFERAHLDPMQAADLNRLRSLGRNELGYTIIDARQRVWDAMQALGGIRSPAASAAWHVLGVGAAINHWGGTMEDDKRKAFREDTARGVVVAALGILAAHYGLQE
jgi:hypothetical protein